MVPHSPFLWHNWPHTFIDSGQVIILSYLCWLDLLASFETEFLLNFAHCRDFSKAYLHESNIIFWWCALFGGHNDRLCWLLQFKTVIFLVFSLKPLWIMANETVKMPEKHKTVPTMTIANKNETYIVELQGLNNLSPSYSTFMMQASFIG